MKHAKIITALSLAALIALGAVPVHADTGSSLAATMDFIVKKINAQGFMKWSVSDTKISGSEINVTAGRVMDNARYDLDNNCIIYFHAKNIMNDTVADGNVGLNISDVVDIQIEPIEKIYYRENARDGAPDREIRVSPSVYSLELSSKKDLMGSFAFYNEATADRVAKAFAHAVQLCGGFKPEAF